MIARQLHLDLPCLQLGLLQTKDIGVGRRKKLHKVFAHDRSQTIDIPRNQFHFFYPFRHASAFAVVCMLVSVSLLHSIRCRLAVFHAS